MFRCQWPFFNISNFAVNHCKVTNVKCRSLAPKNNFNCTIKSKYTLKTTLLHLKNYNPLPLAPNSLKQRRAILVMNHDSMVQILAKNSFLRKYFNFSGFHAHNAIACVFYVKNGYEGPKPLLALLLTHGSNVFLNLLRICDILVCNMTSFWESQFSDIIDHLHKSALK